MGDGYFFLTAERCVIGQKTLKKGLNLKNERWLFFLTAEMCVFGQKMMK